jgi:hypothetical protein
MISSSCDIGKFGYARQNWLFGADNVRNDTHAVQAMGKAKPTTAIDDRSQGMACQAPPKGPLR